MDFAATRRTCWVGQRLGPDNRIVYHRCGKPRWGWTNYMEPLCLEHFQQRRFIQQLMVMLSGCGSWGALIVHNNPERFAESWPTEK